MTWRKRKQEIGTERPGVESHGAQLWQHSRLSSWRRTKTRRWSRNPHLNVEEYLGWSKQFRGLDVKKVLGVKGTERRPALLHHSELGGKEEPFQQSIIFQSLALDFYQLGVGSIIGLEQRNDTIWLEFFENQFGYIVENRLWDVRNGSRKAVGIIQLR